MLRATFLAPRRALGSLRLGVHGFATAAPALTDGSLSTGVGINSAPGTETVRRSALFVATHGGAAGVSLRDLGRYLARLPWRCDSSSRGGGTLLDFVRTQRGGLGQFVKKHGKVFAVPRAGAVAASPLSSDSAGVRRNLAGISFAASIFAFERLTAVSRFRISFSVFVFRCLLFALALGRRRQWYA